jgi:hypothetical protein
MAVPVAVVKRRAGTTEREPYGEAIVVAEEESELLLLRYVIRACESDEAIFPMLY